MGISATVIPGFMLGSLFVIMGPALGYGEAGSGVLVASFFGASAFTSAPLGRWVDRRGPDVTLRVALIASAVLQTMIGLVGRSVASIAIMALFAGTANALCQVSGNVWIARNVREGRQGVAFALKQSSNPAASLVSGLAIPALAETFGWRAAFGAGVALAIIALIAMGSRADEQGPSTTTTDEPAHRRPSAVLVSLAVAAALSAAAAVTLGSFFVNSAVHSGVATGAAGVMLAVGSLIAIGSRLCAGAWADRRGGALLGLVAAMLSIGAVSYLVFIIGLPWAHIVGLPLAFGAGWAWPGVFNLSVVRAHPDEPGRATGITQSGTYVGASTGPLLFGIIAEHAGYSWAWMMASVLSLAAAASVLNARRVLVRSTGQPLPNIHL